MTELSPASKPVLAPQDLAEVLQAYSAVAERLQESHETLQGEVQRLQDELVRKNEQLERGKRLAALGEMAAGIAHEIRNPLAAIQLYIEMIREDVATEHAAAPRQLLAGAVGHSEKIADAVCGLSGIVNDVLSFSRTIDPVARPLDAAAVLERAVAAQRPVLDAAGVMVETCVESPALFADPDLLHRVLLNLVRNAAEAMADSERVGVPNDMAGDVPRVLTLSILGGVLTVADTGPGIDMAAVGRIFNPFFTTRGSGTGLGLAIVHRIVDGHGGSIAVRNREPESGFDGTSGGAIFTLQFPLEAPELGLMEQR
ncbi:MAG: ATP-binding protein [Algisphaera sp.]